MKAEQRIIGPHLRVQKMLLETIQCAQQLGVTAFQSFISVKGSGKRLLVNQHHIQEFVRHIHTFNAIFFHASYKINPSSCSITYHYILEHEVQLAIELGVPALILHPGWGAGCEKKGDAIDALARTLNIMQRKYPSIVFILENGVHGNACIGGDIEDFSQVLAKLDYPDRVQFCIDTAHAFCYGYDIHDEQMREAFVQLLENTIGIHNIALLHINDTREQLGSNHDHHAVLGKGSIGIDALRAFAIHPKLVAIPIILELPELSVQDYKDVLASVRAWHL